MRLNLLAAALFSLSFCSSNQQSLDREPNQVAQSEVDLPAYSILRVKNSASLEELTQAAFEIRENPKLSPDEKMRAQIAYALLSNEELRSQYDRSKGESFDMKISPANLEELSKLLSMIDPPAANRLRKTGQIAARTAASMTTFYIALGMMEAWNCFSTRDAEYCRAYVRSLKDPVAHTGFVLFMGTSHVIQNGSVKVFGDSVAKRTLSGFVGMAGGSLVSELFSEFFHHPMSKAYINSFKIEDPEKREAAKDEARSKLWSQTFANPEWRSDKVPGLIALILAAGASQLTLEAGSKVVSHMRSGSLCKRALSKFFVIPPSGFKAKAGQRLRRVPAEIGHLLVFLKWDHVLRPKTAKAWQLAILDQNIRTLMKEIKASAQKIAAGQTDETEKFEELLKLSEKAWDKHRKNRTTELDIALVTHIQAVNKFDEIIGKPYLFYSWFVQGMPETGAEFDFVEQRPESEQLVFMESFFCGTLVQNAYKDAWEIHGLPIPGKWSPKVVPYKVAQHSDPNFCSNIATMNSQQKIQSLREEFLKKNYSAELKTARNVFIVATHDQRLEIVKKYEDQVQHKIQSFMKDDSVNLANLPNGVLASFTYEQNFLNSIQQILPHQSTLATMRENLLSKRSAAETLLAYMELPFEERVPPDMEAADLLAALQGELGGEIDQATAVRRIFNGFIIK